MTTHQQYWKQLQDVRLQIPSDDPDTQTACILVPWGHRAVIKAVNRIPDALNVSTERVTRPGKYAFIQHAERRAICTAAKDGISTLHATMYLNWFPCSDCATDIIVAGIRDLHVDGAQYVMRQDDPRYGFAQAMEKLKEAGVRIVWH